MRSSCQASLRYSSVAVQSIRDRPSSIVDLEIDLLAYWRKGENVFIKKLQGYKILKKSALDQQNISCNWENLFYK